MQLVIISLVLFFLVLTQNIRAQVRNIANKQFIVPNSDTSKEQVSTYENPDWKTIDINFLSSYYTQDGNNSPVTGGEGTEQLTDFTQKIILSIPLREKTTLKLDGGYDFYSSASTDNIDNVRSSDSESDMRTHANIGISQKLDKQNTIGGRIGGSTEYDYNSLSVGFDYSHLSKDENTSIGFSAQAFIDQWTLIYPDELRGTAKAATDQRQSYNGALTISRVLNKRMQIALNLEATYMNGLLSTPFHRVYFQEQNEAKIELLPSNRLKVPIGVRLNTHITEFLIARTYYRYYWDDWGVRAHTVSLELPVKINRFFSIAPFYRYHTQTAADYFLPYKQHSINDAFYTSDYDLSAVSSNSFGLGASYSPASGLARVKLPFKNRRLFMVKGVDLKYSHYERSNGLKADIISLGFSFEL